MNISLNKCQAFNPRWCVSSCRSPRSGCHDEIRCAKGLLREMFVLNRAGRMGSRRRAGKSSDGEEGVMRSVRPRWSAEPCRSPAPPPNHTQPTFYAAHKSFIPGTGPLPKFFSAVKGKVIRKTSGVFFKIIMK